MSMFGGARVCPVGLARWVWPPVGQVVCFLALFWLVDLEKGGGVNAPAVDAGLL